MLGHLHDAVQLEERALRYKYLAGRVDEISIFHHNLAVAFARIDRPHEALAHSLIGFQTYSGLLATQLATLRWLLSGLGDAAPLPGGFDELCDRLAQLDDVRFRQLLQRLPQRAPSPDQALSQVLELARQSPPSTSTSTSGASSPS